ncbi:hypothetical protein G4B88_019417 [Cannabis sativa]|uniref:DUF4283 domain-containing protein n=1 Tax=Cannabis sativa TaxID=3483 RepID=A0A7J6HZR2_CANSA|nr:hypothetical protein G4B88_019417 [Cannabis sativa]
MRVPKPRAILLQTEKLMNDMVIVKDLSCEEVRRSRWRLTQLIQVLRMVNRVCVGKVMGCKNMVASVVKKILLGVWNLNQSWCMKKFEEGVLGFFFDFEEDCTLVMNKRPWLVNGVLLNLKPCPLEGEV